MNEKRQVPVAAMLAMELAMVAVGGGTFLWMAQDIIVKALRFVLPTMVG